MISSLSRAFHIIFGILLHIYFQKTGGTDLLTTISKLFLFIVYFTNIARSKLKTTMANGYFIIVSHRRFQSRISVGRKQSVRVAERDSAVI